MSDSSNQTQIGFDLRNGDRLRLFEAMVSSTADFVYIFDLAGRFLYANPSLLSLWGKTLEEAVGKNFFDLDYPRELAARLQQQIQEVIATGALVKDETVYKDVHERVEFYEYLLSPVFESGKIIAVSGTTRRMTGRWQREQELKRLTEQTKAQARLFDTTLSSINDLAYTFDLEGNWTYANKPLLDLWGKTLDEIVEKSSLQLDYPPELAERLKQQVKQVVATKKPFKGETFFTSGAGVVDYHEYIFSPVFALDGSVVSVCGTTRLITERKRAEEQMRLRNERMQLLSETLGQLLSARNAETVVRELFPKVAKHLGADTYFHYMPTEDGKALQLHSCGGLDPSIMFQFHRLELGEGICGAVAKTRQPMVVEQIQDSNHPATEKVRGIGMEVYICNPLMVGDRLLGTLSFGSRSRSSFDEDELEFVQIISQYTAIALDRMQTTQVLRHREAQISTIINKSPVGVYLVDAQFCIQQVNPRAEPVFRTIKNVIGADFEKVLQVLWPAEVAGSLVARFRHTLKTGESFYQSGFGESRADSDDTEFYDWEIHRITLPDGQYGVVCYFSDVTAHVRAQQKVEESAEQLRLALSAGDLGDWVWDAESDQMTLSPRTAEIYGVNPEPPATRTEMRRLLVPEDAERARLALEKSIATGTDYSIEYRIKPENRLEYRWLAARGRPIYRKNGQIQGMLGVVQDITQRKKNEDALRESNEQLESRVIERTNKLQETIEELESFSYSISHDLRAPLRAMQSFATILEEEYKPNMDETGKDYLRRIARSAERMDRLIQDILVYSRVARADLNLIPLNLNALLNGILESYPQFETTKVEIKVAGVLPPVLANDAALTQCLSNLMGNSLKFVAPGIKPRIEIWASKKGEFVRLFIRDNGIGIEKEFHDRIFGIFQKLDKTYDGTGIGLAIVKKAVERMGGSVGLESTPSEGTTFWLDLKSPPATEGNC